MKIDWALDTLDLLVTQAAIVPAERNKFVDAVANRFPQFGKRVDDGQWMLLALLSSELGRSDIANLVNEFRETETTAESPGLAEKLRGITITIYTLTETAAQRAKAVLSSLCSDVTVNLSHEKVGSDRLKQWARNSDIFVMVTASAKYAATGFIETNRQGKPIIRPKGKGSASILSSLSEYLMQEA